MFLRRCLLNFGKFGFSEMVKLYQNFSDYKNDRYKYRNNGESAYLIDKKLEDLQIKVQSNTTYIGYHESKLILKTSITATVTMRFRDKFRILNVEKIMIKLAI